MVLKFLYFRPVNIVYIMGIMRIRMTDTNAGSMQAANLTRKVFLKFFF